MVPQEPFCLLPQLIADSLNHRHLFHQLRQGVHHFRLHQRLICQIRGGTAGTLAQQLHIQHLILQMVNLNFAAVGPQ